MLGFSPLATHAISAMRWRAFIPPTAPGAPLSGRVAAAPVVDGRTSRVGALTGDARAVDTVKAHT